MLKLQKLDGRDIYTFRVEGDLDEQSVRRFYDALEQKAAGGKQLRLLGIIQDFPKLKDFIALGELAKTKTKALRSIGKYAIISDTDWMATLLPVSNFLTPGLPIRHFEPHQRHQAIAWLEADQEAAPADQVAELGMTLQQLPNSDVFAFIIDGRITDHDVTRLYQTFQEKAQTGKIKLLGTVRAFSGFESVRTLVNGVKADLAAIGQVEKMAMLTDKGWLDKLVQVGDALTPTLAVKAFGLDEQAQALRWLEDET